MWTVLSTWNTSNWFQSDIIRRFFAENSDLWRRCLLGECFIVLLLTFFEFVWNRPKSWKGSGNLSPEWLERRKYESCWLVWHYSFLYCRKFRPLTTRNDLWRRFLLGSVHMHIDSFFSDLQHIFNNFLRYSLQALIKDIFLTIFYCLLLFIIIIIIIIKRSCSYQENVMCDSFEVNIKKLQFFFG